MELAAGNDRTIVATARGDYSTTFTVDQDPHQAFGAIVDVRGWWAENIDGPTDQVGGVFVFHNEPIHYSRIEVTELVPGKRVAWRILDNFMSFVDDKTEWIGNEVVFDITRDGNQTNVVFTQIGLVPDYECYEICSDAWGGYVRHSLRNLIATGKGDPIPKPW